MNWIKNILIAVSAIIVVLAFISDQRPDLKIVENIDVTATASAESQSHKDDNQEEIFRCPMHPQIVSDRPGSCPICGMDLVKVEPEDEQATNPETHSEHDEIAKSAEPQAPIYICPMHPQIISDRPGSCPICGMDLVEVEQETESNDAIETNGAEMPPGLTMVRLNEGKRQLIGIKTVPAKFEMLTKSVRASATIKPDERRIKQAQSKIQGWIERRYVNFTGQYVKRGQPLLSIYSPDLVSTQEEYLLALRNLEALEGSDPMIRGHAERLVDASRRRLKYWDISKRQIEKIERTGEPSKTMTLYSPARGYVMHTNAMEGMEVKPGMPLYTIADLSRVWLIADVHEHDLAIVKKGMRAVLHADAFPGKEFRGRVTYIDPALNPQTRTASVRIELKNPDMELKIEMRGEVILTRNMGKALVVPSSAVMDNGDFKVVFVEVEPGLYMPREVKTRNSTSEQVEIIEGLEEGEIVVVRGNFLLDSESRLKASLPGAAGGHNH